MGIREDKNKQAEAYLQYLVANLNSGEVLPPLRQMMRDSGLGRNVLENALRKLEASHKLKIRARSGIYVIGEDGGPDENYVDIIACSEINYLNSSIPGCFALRLLNTILSEVATHSYIPRLHRVNYYALVTEYAELIQKQKIRRAILLMPHHNDIPRLFAAAGVPHVVILPRYYPDRGPAVIDSPEIVEIQLNHLFEHGHRKIGFIHSVDLGMDFLTGLLRRESFYRFMGEHALPVHPEWVIHYTLDHSKLRERFDLMFSTSEHPTAIVVEDWVLKSVYTCMNERGLEIGKDISIISSDGQVGGLTPLPASVINSPVKIAELGWSFFEQSLKEPDFSAIDSVEPGIQEGQSVATL
ncbi:MAG TPA: hypothetical protein DE060_18535 [Lentisphaeria bacterium]|nr:hypothetical protein [Lentisphaeria bacterium]HCG51188.1 hypothetical protein [Lentisphaeria bacterium]